jgi:sulfide:quinone oxidoreductase
MQKILILGGGTAGTMAANQLRKTLPKQDWEITVVDQDDKHVYQPGLLLMPFGVYTPERLVRSRKNQFAKNVKLVNAEVDLVKANENKVSLVGGQELLYDYLIIASGTTPRPDQTPGMDGEEFGKSIFEFYTLEGATALRDKLQEWQGGRLVVHITEMPIKCPVAPLEFSFLADSYFKKMGIRDKVEIVYVTPLEGAFTKPVASATLGGMLDERDIKLEADFVIEQIDDERKVLISMDEREIPFDLLVTIPLNMGADFIARSGLGNDLNYVKVDKETMLSTVHNNIFVLGDASDIPASKAGSVAHFAIDLFIENFQQHVAGKKMTHLFDGHANCYIESGNRKGLLIDFNYETQPLTGHFPLPKVGPFSLLKETRINHLGKLAFEWIYWNLLLPGRKLPVSTLMSMTGKILPKTN